MCMFCRPLFVLLSCFFWPLRCLSFIDLRILITSLYLYTLLGASSTEWCQLYNKFWIYCHFPVFVPCQTLSVSLDFPSLIVSSLFNKVCLLFMGEGQGTTSEGKHCSCFYFAMFLLFRWWTSSTCIWSIYLSVHTLFQNLWFLSGYPW